MRIFRPSYMQDLAFYGIEVHIPLHFPIISTLWSPSCKRRASDRELMARYMAVSSTKSLTLDLACSRRSLAYAKNPAGILRKSTSGRHRPVRYPDGLMTARYKFT